MKVNTTTETVLALADGLDAGRGAMGPSPLAAVLRAPVGERDRLRYALKSVAGQDATSIPSFTPVEVAREALAGAQP